MRVAKLRRLSNDQRIDRLWDFEGQTATIAEYLAGVIRDQGHAAFPVDIEPGRPTGWLDAVIVGASVHMGKHQTWVRDFVPEEPTRARAAALRILLGESRRSGPDRGSTPRSAGLCRPVRP